MVLPEFRLYFCDGYQDQGDDEVVSGQYSGASYGEHSVANTGPRRRVGPIQFAGATRMLRQTGEQCEVCEVNASIYDPVLSRCYGTRRVEDVSIVIAHHAGLREHVASELGVP